MRKSKFGTKILGLLGAIVIGLAFLSALGPQVTSAGPIFFALNQMPTVTAPPALVQSNSGFALSGSKAVAFSSNVTAGNLLFVCALIDNGASPSVGDNRANTWNQILLYNVASHGQITCWYAANVFGGATTVTLNGSGITYINMAIGEVSGVATTNPVDAYGTNSATGGTVTVTSSAIAITSDEYVAAFGASWDGNATFTQGTGYTIKQQVNDPTNGDAIALEEKNSATGLSGAQTATFTKNNTSQTWLAAIIAFRSAATPAGTPDVQGITGGTDVNNDNVLAAASVPTVSWSAVPQSGSYDVVIYQDDGTTVQCAAVNTVTAVTSYMLAGCTTLTAGNYYKAKVLTRNSGGTLTGANSALYRFYYPGGGNFVLPVYATYGANWNDYVAKTGNSPISQSDAPCTLSMADRCMHAGEIRKVVTTKTSCTNLTVSETLGAFDWYCDASGGNAIYYATGLKANKGLGDIVQESGWIANPVTVYESGVGILTTSGNWYSNTVTALPDNSATSVTNLATAGTIYVLDSSRATKGYNINANKVALVIRPSATLRFVGSTNNCNATTAETGTPGKRCLVGVGTQSNVWVEGALEGQTVAIDYGVLWKDVKLSRINRLSLDKATLGGVQIDGSSNGNLLRTITVKNVNTANTSLYLGGDYNLVQNFSASGGWGNWIEGDYNRLTNIRVANTANRPIDLNGSDFTTIHQARISNGAYGAILCYTCWDATISMVTANNLGSVGGGTGGYSLLMTDADNNTVLGFSTFSQGGTGAFSVAYSANYNTLVNVGAAGWWGGMSIYSSDNTKVANFYNFLSWGDGISVDTSSSNTFSESLLFGGNGNNCAVSGGTNPGLVNSTCANQGTSTATALTGVGTPSYSYVGKVIADDSANTSDSSGSMTYSATQDWLNFDNWYRGWGIDDVNWSETSDICSSGTCRIWDFRLLASDTLFKNRLGTAFVAGTTCPAAVHGNRAITDQAQSPRTFLLNAYEIVDNWRLNPGGNNNGLCESGEACIYTPNLGTYQGEGDYEANGTCTFQNGTVSNVTMYGYPTNGVTAITARGVPGTTFNTASPASVNLPTGVSNGDLVLIFVVAKGGAQAPFTFTPPAGYTLVSNTNVTWATNSTVAVYAHTWTTGDPTSVSFSASPSPSNKLNMIAAAYYDSGGGSVSVDTCASQSNAAGTTYTSPSIGPLSTSSDMLVMFYSADSTSGTLMSSPSTGTLQSVLTSRAAMADQLLQSSAATGNQTITGVNATSAGIQCALKRP